MAAVDRAPRAVFLSAPRDVRGPVGEAVTAALARAGAERIVVEPGERWADVVTDAIERADFVVADVADLGPNQMYELGYAHASRKPLLILVDEQRAGELPFDIRTVRFLIYDPEDLEGLSRQLAAAMPRLVRSASVS